MMRIPCKHWSPTARCGVGLCKLNLFGGRPSHGTCHKCKHYGSGMPPVDHRIIENIRKQHGPCRGCGD